MRVRDLEILIVRKICNTFIEKHQGQKSSDRSDSYESFR